MTTGGGQRAGQLDDSGREVLRLGNLTMELARYYVTIASRPVRLTYKEFQLLQFLVAHPGQIFDRDTLVRRAWAEEPQPEGRKVDIQVTRLRRKLEGLEPYRIVTVKKRGYGLAKEVGER